MVRYDTLAPLTELKTMKGKSGHMGNIFHVDIDQLLFDEMDTKFESNLLYILLQVQFRKRHKDGSQPEVSDFSFSSLSLSAGPGVSSVDASLVDVAVFGLSSGLSVGSTTLAPRLVLQPMIWQNPSFYRVLLS